jgi:diguanylate cyclase
MYREGSEQQVGSLVPSTPAVSEGAIDENGAGARRALHLMAEYGVPATPQNFEVWLRFARGTHPELNKTINILISNKRPFDEATNSGLYFAYAQAAAGDSDKCLDISRKLHKVLEEARAFLAASLNESRQHAEVLHGVSKQLAVDNDPRTIVRALVGELTRAVARAANLESHFAASLEELDSIRSTLAAAEQRSKIDQLTGLANRHALDEFLRAAQAAAMERGLPLSIFLLDVDHFKKFNDNFGHQFGDQVLRLISSVLKDGLRNHDLAARYGGEELVGVLPGADLDAAFAVAERVRQTIARRRVTLRATGETLSTVKVSVGVAQFEPGETLADLFQRCDRALYQAKGRGRNCTVTEAQLACAVGA